MTLKVTRESVCTGDFEKVLSPLEFQVTMGMARQDQRLPPDDTEGILLFKSPQISGFRRFH